MKSFAYRLMAICLLATLAGTAAFAKTRKSNIDLSSDTKVNGTLVKKGMYRVLFDEQSGELSISRNDKLIVKTTARVEKRPYKARTLELHTVVHDMEENLVGIAFKGSDENVVLTQAGMQAGGN